MQVQPVTVGPIVGATTATAVRLWGRGKYEKIQSGPRRCFGVARIRQAKAGSSYRQPQYFKMNPNFDMTGITIFDNLKAESRYNYQMGWFFSDLELDEVQADSRPLDWDIIPTYHFTTGSALNDRSRSFIFGSCRYLLRLFGGTYFDNRGDKTFRSILRQIRDQGQRTDAIFMIGDQIYADDLNFLHADDSISEYLQRYRDAFSQPHIRELMSHVPTYMTLDDHEIEDGWPAHSTDHDWMIKYPAAIHAYKIYQISHSPLFERKGNRLTGIPNKYWYAFSDGCADFFFTDTRTERYLPKEPAEKEIISQAQMEAVKAWLADGSGRVKFLVSAVPVFPGTKMSNSDKWGGFPNQQSELLDFIWQEKIEKVVFLSGDVHSSLSAELVKEGDTTGFKVISVISSPYYWPYPHNPRRVFNLKGKIKSTLSHNVYRVVNAGRVVSTDNFTRVTVDLAGLEVTVYGRKGNTLSRRTIPF